MLYDNLAVNEQGHLTVGGLDTVALAEEFGAPLYVLDEDKLRENCRTYVQALRENMPEGSYPLFAGKALCFKGLYPVLNEEGMGADVVSPGEIYTALAGGFPAEKLYFHGNNKTDEDIAYALDSHVGCFIVDNHQELARLDEAAGVRGIRQRVLLRVTPGIDPHTLQAINTGRIDCQFGVPIETGQAAQFVADALSRKNLIVEGFHSHIGSQIFEAEPFCDAVDILLDFAQAMREAHGFVAETLNLGGGHGLGLQGLFVKRSGHLCCHHAPEILVQVHLGDLAVAALDLERVSAVGQGDLLLRLHLRVLVLLLLALVDERRQDKYGGRRQDGHADDLFHGSTSSFCAGGRLQ